jgi:hypothetical protein
MNSSIIQHRVMERACVRRTFTWEKMMMGTTNYKTRTIFFSELLRSVGQEGESKLRVFLWEKRAFVSCWSSFRLSAVLLAIQPYHHNNKKVVGMAMEIIKHYSSDQQGLFNRIHHLPCQKPLTPPEVITRMRFIVRKQPVADLEEYLEAFEPVLQQSFCTQHDQSETLQLLLCVVPASLVVEFVRRTFSHACMRASTRACSERQRDEDDKLLVLRLARLVKRIGLPLPIYSRRSSSTIQELGTCQFQTITRTSCTVNTGMTLQGICNRAGPIRFSLQRTLARDKRLTSLRFRLRMVREKKEQQNVWVYLASLEPMLFLGDQRPNFPGTLLGIIALYLGLYTHSFDIRTFIRVPFQPYVHPAQGGSASIPCS